VTDELRVILEVGKKRRVVAAAIDWPGLDRWGISEETAVEKLTSYLPRYAGVADRAGRRAEFERIGPVDIAERVPGSSSTDFWGVAHVPSRIEAEILAPPELERRLELLQATWAYFDDVTTRAPAELLPGPRSAGRTRDQIIRHVIVNEPEQFSRKVEVRTEREVVLTPDGLAGHRRAYLEAIRAYNSDGRAARSWPIQFLIRRTAHHAMDHAWEVEDRTPDPG